MATSIVGTGGDYATLALWESAGEIETGTWIASCLSGSDLQWVTINGAGWAGRPPIIENAIGHRHDGQTGGAYCTAGASVHCIWNNITGPVIVSGIHFSIAGTKVGYRLDDNSGGHTGVVIEDCLFVVTSSGTNTQSVFLQESGNKALGDVTVRNCLFYGVNSPSVNYGIRVSVYLASSTITLNVYNCSLSRISTNAGGRGISLVNGAGAITYDIKNTIAVGTTTDFAISGAGTRIDAGSSHNLSSDATAPGTSGLINQTAADVFVNVATDLHLKAGSPAIGAGTKVLYYDALGNPRGTPDDMGALTTYVAATTAALFYYYRRLRAR